MSRKRDFTRELDRLFRRRTRWLKSVIGERRPGPLPTFNRKTVNRGIDKLQGIASVIFATQLAKQEFATYAPLKRSWQVKSHRYEQKREIFDAWFKRKFGEHRNCVYIFGARRAGASMLGVPMVAKTDPDRILIRSGLEP